MVISKELQEQVAEQRRLLQSVASVGEELLSQQTTPNGDRYFFF